MSPRTSQVLWVWLGEEPVAELRPHNGRLRLRYLPGVVERYGENVPLLSCSLPTSLRWLDARPFFDGVLPEGRHRAALAAGAGVVAADTFALLARFGRDIAGAASVVASDDGPPGRRGSIEHLDDEALALEVDSLDEHPLGIHDDSELSIAGLQNKLLLVRTDEGWARPRHGQPSTHILKVDHPTHTGLVAAEADALRLARHVGLTDVEVDLMDVAGRSCIAVSRFDRRSEGVRLSRVHQEDICQALGLAPTRKYELRQGGGGPSFADVARLLDEHSEDPEVQLDRLVAVAAFTAIVGNADAHGKNLALLHTAPGRVVLAPVYDPVPTVLWPRLDPEAAMTIGGAVELDSVDADAIAREARSWRHDPDRAVAVATDVSAKLADAVAGLVPVATPALVERVTRRATALLGRS